MYDKRLCFRLRLSFKKTGNSAIFEKYSTKLKQYSQKKSKNGSHLPIDIPPEFISDFFILYNYNV